MIDGCGAKAERSRLTWASTRGSCVLAAVVLAVAERTANTTAPPLCLLTSVGLLPTKSSNPKRIATLISLFLFRSQASNCRALQSLSQPASQPVVVVVVVPFEPQSVVVLLVVALGLPLCTSEQINKANWTQRKQTLLLLNLYIELFRSFIIMLDSVIVRGVVVLLAASKQFCAIFLSLRTCTSTLS